MFRNYLLTAFRNLRKNKTYSFINIAGLAAGISVCLVILLYIQYELSYDRFNDKADRIYRIIYKPGDQTGQPRTPHPMAQALVSDLPEVENAVTMSPIWGPGLTWAEMSVKYKENKFLEKRFFSADTTFFDVFSIKTIKGDAGKAIREAGSLIITESTAKKYFGKEDPIGKVINLDDRYDIIVKAVIQDIPANSHFSFDFLISYLTLKPMDNGNYYTWNDFGHYNYIVLKEGADPAKVQAAIPAWIKKYINNTFDKNGNDLSKNIKLQPLTDIHLNSQLLWELDANGNMSEIYIFSASAILILLIACINFMNISTARSMRRAKEVGVRKSLGAERKHLVLQFLSESLLLTSISAIIAVGLIEIFLPVLTSFTGAPILTGNVNILYYVPGLVLLVIIIGLIAGSYPAFFLSSFRPTEVLSGKLRKGRVVASIRKGLVVFQFAISVFLISSTLIIHSQIDFFRTKNLGFNKDQIIAVPLNSGNLVNNFKSIKTSLLNNENIISAAGTTNVPGDQFDQNLINWKPETSPIDVLEVWVDEDYFKTLDIQVAEGRDFSESFGTDSARSYMLNETAASKYNWDTPVGKEISWIPDDEEIKGNVVGVVKDFNIRSLHENIAPLLIHYQKDGFKNMLIKIKAGNIQAGIASVKKIINEYSPGYSFEYHFLDDYYAKAYESDEKMGTLFLFFSIFAIIIASLGLFGLAAFMAEQKTKEIGIRKVLGASVTGIIINLNSDFIKRVLIANVIAFPAAYFVMDNWLQNFAYHTTMSWWMFVSAGVFTLIIAILTVSWQAVKAAVVNPVNSLKCE